MPGASPAAAAAATTAAAAAFAAAASPLAASPPAASPPMTSVSSVAAATAVCWAQAHVKQEPSCTDNADDDPLDDDRSRSPVDDSGISPGRSSSSSGGGGGGSGDREEAHGGGSGSDSGGPSPDRPPSHWPPLQQPQPQLPRASVAAADVPYCVQLQLQADGPLRRLQNALESARIGQQTKSEQLSSSWETSGGVSFGGMGSSPPPVSSHAHPYGYGGGGGPPRSPGDDAMDVTDADPDGDCAESGGGDEELGLREPRVNAQGKVKQYRCKQCAFVAVTKLAFWDHSRTHIKQEKMLTCPKCPFVTEYKHHLEYHLRNHFGSKPFKCDKCPYTCVNKSMLNSHMKSHSSVYQYRCADCSYATKYMHSLKLHLRKYTHKPDMVLNPDGSPNPLPIIDVYGTRRGPKCKPNTTPSRPDGGPSGGCAADAMVSRFPGAGAFPTAFLLRPPPPPLAYAYNPFLSGFSPFPPMMGNVEEGVAAAAARLSPAQASSTPVAAPPAPPTPAAAEPVDLSRPDPTPDREEMTTTTPHTPAAPPPTTADTAATAKANRRKGKAYKLERVALAQSSEDEDEGAGSPRAATQEAYHCSYCAITFRDVVMYTMHMGYHGYADPFTCNMCGHATTDRVSFFLHIARSPHC